MAECGWPTKQTLSINWYYVLCGLFLSTLLYPHLILLLLLPRISQPAKQNIHGVPGFSFKRVVIQAIKSCLLFCLSGKSINIITLNANGESFSMTPSHVLCIDWQITKLVCESNRWTKRRSRGRNCVWWEAPVLEGSTNHHCHRHNHKPQKDVLKKVANPTF